MVEVVLFNRCGLISPGIPLKCRKKFVTSTDIHSTMNDLLKKKLASYSAATAALLAANHFSSHAQIIYTNIPDTAGLQVNFNDGYGTHYDLDLNNDGIVDFKIDGFLLTYSPYGTEDAYVKVTQVLGNELELHFAYAAQLDCGEIINGQANFLTNNSDRALTGVFWSGWNGSDSVEYSQAWDDLAPHLLGVRIKVGNDTLYGWVRLKVANYSEFEIYDYAYNSTPNQEIAACDTSSFATSASITSEEQSSITAFVNADNLMAIVSNNLLPNTLRVTNIMGEPILSKKIIEEKNEITLSAFPPGIYLVTIGDGKSPWSKKIVLSR